MSRSLWDAWVLKEQVEEDSKQLFFNYVLKQPANYSSHRSVAAFERDKCINMMQCKSPEAWKGKLFVKNDGLALTAFQWRFSFRTVILVSYPSGT